MNNQTSKRFVSFAIVWAGCCRVKACIVAKHVNFCFISVEPCLGKVVVFTVFILQSSESTKVNSGRVAIVFFCLQPLSIIRPANQQFNIKIAFFNHHISKFFALFQNNSTSKWVSSVIFKPDATSHPISYVLNMIKYVIFLNIFLAYKPINTQSLYERRFNSIQPNK